MSSHTTSLWREAFAIAETLDALSPEAVRGELARIEGENPALARCLELLRTDAAANVANESRIARVLQTAQAIATTRFQSDDTVGPYTLIRSLGTGGMSDVWLARRTDGSLKRMVALKLPMAALPKHILEGRFNRERDILAQLDHRHIAKIYDTGTTAEGQPFLALEFVDGQALDTYSQENRLTIKQRVELIIAAAQGVHHAHSRLVLHRDLKPSNILVTREGELKILDFGIAKLLADDRTAEETQFTKMTGTALTPKYAAPEQLLSQTVTMSTDVYALAVVLFELLTGATPFPENSKEFGERLATLERPCTLLSGAQIAAPQLRALNLSSAKAAKRAFAGDLTAILEKALRRTPEDRYDSALAFADDLQRYLEHEPVLARKGSTLYRLSKFARRHKAPLAVGLAGTLAAMALGTQALLQSQRAAQQAARADSIDGLMESLFQGMSPDVAKTRTFTAKELLDRASGGLLGQSDAAIGPQYFQRMANLYRDIGEHKAAGKFFAQSRDAFDARGERLDALRTHIDLVDVLGKGNSLTDAERELTAVRSRMEGLDVPSHIRGRQLNVEGQLAVMRLDGAQALKVYATAESVWRSIVPVNVEQLVWSLEGQAIAARLAMRTGLAKSKMEEVLAIDQQNPVRGQADLLRSRATYGTVLVGDGRYAQASKVLTPVCDEYHTRLGGRHPETRLMCRALVMAFIRQGEWDASAQVTKRLRDANRDDRNELLQIEYLEALVSMYQGRFDDAEPAMRAITDWVVSQNRQRRTDSALRMQRNYAELLLRSKKEMAALELLTDIVETLKERHGVDHPDTAYAELTRSVALARLGKYDGLSEQCAATHRALRKHRGEHHQFALAARAYCVVFGGEPLGDAPALATQLRAELGWQPDLASLAAIILSPEGVEGRRLRAALPIIL